MSSWQVEAFSLYGEGGPTRRYQVFRLIDPEGPSFGKNKETAGIYLKKSEANAAAKRLNSEGTSWSARGAGASPANWQNAQAATASNVRPRNQR